VQTGLRLTLPGVPDLFQGAEFWDFSLVDPDNRRPVDYAARRAALDAQRPPPSWRDGAYKQALIARLLGDRRARPDLFTAPLRHIEPTGARASQALAFERTSPKGRLVVVAALHGAQACMDRGEPLIAPGWWADTALPDGRRLAEIMGQEPFWWSID
jgi:(1->4)-alpha-D-glucan 1-alpha-D-glucosylmutase